MLFLQWRMPFATSNVSERDCSLLVRSVTVKPSVQGGESDFDRACIQTIQTYTDFLQTEADCIIAATEPFECVVNAVCSHTHSLETLLESQLPEKQTTGTNTSQVTQSLQQPELQREEKTSSRDNFSAAANNSEIPLQFQRMAYDWRLRPWMLNATEFQPQMKAAVWRSNPQEYSIRGTDIPNETYVTNHLRKLNQQLKNPHSAPEAYVKLQTYWRTAIALVNPQIQSEFSSLKQLASNSLSRLYWQSANSTPMKQSRIYYEH